MRRAIAWAIQAGTRGMVRRFEADLGDPQRAQREVRDRILQASVGTDYANHWGVSSSADFARLPITDYDQLRPWVDQQRSTEGRVLTHQKVLFYEKTSGSTGPAKYIPYTQALRQTFTHMFLLWTHDLVRGIPGLGSGRFYFSISPKFSTTETTDQGRPVGLEDDADYLGPLKWLMKPFFVDTTAAARLRQPDAFKLEVCKALVAAADLEAISIWNPSFLTVLLDTLSDHRDQIAPFAGERASAFTANDIDYHALWPRLKLLSCWADGHAEPLARVLQERFAYVTLQGKGLLATEAPMTIPLLGVQGGVPLVNEVYFEFELPDGSICELHELPQNVCAKLILTQPGGLLRYRIGDEVEAIDQYHQTPTLKFLGRGERFSDLVGEKLSEGYVQTVLENTLSSVATHRQLIPMREPHAGYLLVIDRASDAQALVQSVESEFLKAHHYAHARALGQLAPLQICVQPHAERALAEFYPRVGLRWGDVKPGVLLNRVADPQLLADLRQNAVVGAAR